MKTIIETERLYFGEFLESDDKNILELDSDPEVHQYLGQNPISNIGEAREIVKFIRQQYSDNGIGRLAIFEKASKEFVGWGGFKLITQITNGHQNYHDLGYRFIKRFWGKGYATESSRAVVQYGFNELKLPVIYAIADVGNLKSQNVLKKCGFVEQEVFLHEHMMHYWYELRNH
jgi:ribosomal-protein-alanine N-acetyltransferase